jgi:excisionase family DNA binding protein
MDSQWMTKKEAATYLKISVTNLTNKKGEIPHFKIKGRVLFKRSDLDAWVESHKVPVIPAMDMKAEAKRIMQNLANKLTRNCEA